MNKTKMSVLAAVAASLSAAGQVQAQQGALQVEEILVTARKRLESVQDVPLSIVPFQAEALERRDIQNMEDLAGNTIGMSYNGGISSGVQATVTLRGLATNHNSDRFQNVGIYLDGLYLQTQSMMNVGMVDLARVEIVKGPQNALYGRNAFAGAINYVPQRPSDELEAYLMTTQGSDERQDYRAAIGGTIIKDKLFGRLSGGVSEYDGANENPHPLESNAPGFHNEGNLGGWDDQTINASLIFAPTDNFELSAAYYDTEIKREFQGSYFINGLQEVARFGTSQFDDMNSNQKTIPLQGIPVPVTGNTIWTGELPYAPSPGTFIYPLGEPVEDTSIPGAVDPRGFGTVVETELFSINMAWDINDDWAVKYQYGQIEHDSSTSGPAARDPLVGSSYSDIVTTLYSSDFSSRPMSSLETDSHELRVEWNGGDKLYFSGGVYFSTTEEETFDLTTFGPPCSDADLNGDGSNADELAGCDVLVAPGVKSPLADSVFNGAIDFFDTYWGGNPSNLTQFDDEVVAVFAEFAYDITDNVVLRVEGRYTEEEREIKRLTDIFALAPGESGTGFGVITGPVTFESSISVPEDGETFDYFTPRVSIDWSWSDSSMLYAYAAKGVKSGGFNNATAEADLRYDEETNWTYEIGSKNVFFDNQLTLNGALFYVDWTDVQGSLSPTVQSQNSNVVTGNIGDATNYGLELDATWRFSQAWSVDLAYTWVNPEFEDGAEYDAAQRYYYYECEKDVLEAGELCGNTDMGGKQMAKTSKQQGIAALNYNDTWASGWSVNGRVDAQYRSKQYLTPMNEGYVGSRTLYNGSINVLSPEQHWEITLWGKNLADKEYVSGSFTTSLFNKFLIAQGQGRSYGLTLKYNL